MSLYRVERVSHQTETFYVKATSGGEAENVVRFDNPKPAHIKETYSAISSDALPALEELFDATDTKETRDREVSPLLTEATHTPVPAVPTE